VINTLLYNGYLIDLVFNKTKYKIKKLIEKFNKPEEKTEKADRKIIAFPYIKNISEIVNSAINKNKFLIEYRILNNLTGFIKKHKDKDSVDSSNNVIYKVCCKDCEASCVG